MRLFLARVLPPLAVLFCGKPFSAILNVFLTIFGWYPGVAHALDVVNNHFADKRNIKSIKSINRPEWAEDVFGRPQPLKNKQALTPKITPVNKAVLLDGDPRIGMFGTRFRHKS